MDSVLQTVAVIPEDLSLTPFNFGITTRMLAKRLARNKQKLTELKKNSTDEEIAKYRRQCFKFLEGTAIPNSVIKNSLDIPNHVEKTNAETDWEEFFVKQSQLKEELPSSSNDEIQIKKSLEKIKRKMKERSWSMQLLSNQEKLAINANPSIASLENGRNINDHGEKLKEKRRISCRTSILPPLSGQKRSTFEMIKNAIDNSHVIHQLLDVNSIEQIKPKLLEAPKLIEVQKNSTDSILPSLSVNKTIHNFDSGNSKRQTVTKCLKLDECDSIENLDTTKADIEYNKLLTKNQCLP